jgi:hypothetical protein
VSKSPIIVIDGGKRTKSVLVSDPVDITAADIVSFVDSYYNGQTKEYTIDEQVTYEEISAIEEEF